MRGDQHRVVSRRPPSGEQGVRHSSRPAEEADEEDRPVGGRRRSRTTPGDQGGAGEERTHEQTEDVEARASMSCAAAGSMLSTGQAARLSTAARITRAERVRAADDRDAVANVPPSRREAVGARDPPHRQDQRHVPAARCNRTPRRCRSRRRSCRRRARRRSRVEHAPLIDAVTSASRPFGALMRVMGQAGAIIAETVPL